MTISDNLNRIINAKANIKQAIENKGVEVSDNALLDEYPALIDSIPMEGGDPYYEDLYNIRTNNGTNMAGMFSYCEAPELDLRNLDVSKATNMKYIFSSCSSSVNIDGWDTSKVTDMSYMFWYFIGSIDVSKLNTSSVTNVSSMFQGTNIDNIILTGLSFPSTTSLTYMFNSAKGTILDLSSWDISNIKDMSNMFAGDFTRIDLTGWNTSNVTNMYSMFYKYNNPLEELIIPDWDMTNAGSDNIFYNSSYIPNLKLIDLSRSNDATITKIASFLPTRTTTTFGTVLVPKNISQEDYDALITKYWAPIGAALTPLPTSIEIIAELDEIMPGKSTKVYIGAYEPWNADLSKVELVVLDSSMATIEDNKVISTGIVGDIVLAARIIDTQEVIDTKTIVVSETDSYPNLIKFRLASKPNSYGSVITVNGSAKKLSNLTYDSVTDIYSYDNGAPITSIRFGGSSINELIKLNTDNLTTAELMFYNCQSLVSLNLSDFNNSNITNTGQMFCICSNLAELDLSNFDMTNVTETGNMFYNCSKLHTLRLDNCSYDTISKILNSTDFPTNAIDGVTRTIYCKEENIGDLVAPTNWVFSFVTEEEPEVPVDPPAGDIPLYEHGQFANNPDLTEVRTMVTSEHYDLDSMFSGCNNLVSVNTEDWDTSNVTNMYSMFSWCNSLPSLNLSNWVTDNVTRMGYMFAFCRALTSLNLSNFDTNMVEDMDYMFAQCQSLAELDISNFDTGNVTNMSYMFYDCCQLTSLDLSHFDTSNVTNMNQMFGGSYSLLELNLSNFDASNVTDIGGMFYSCNSLTTLRLDNCSHDTISKIITSEHFPAYNYGTIYCKEENAIGLTAPETWQFSYID